MLFTDDPLFVEANRTEIRQVIWNLILNAVQAMPEGGILRIEAHAAEIEGRAGMEIRIADTGCGIRDQDRQRIFEPFYTTRDTGTGLGLAVVNRITVSVPRHDSYAERTWKGYCIHDLASSSGRGGSCGSFLKWRNKRNAEDPCGG